MKAKQFRIGNYYNHNGEVKEITVNMLSNLFESEDRAWFEPIPLTEEWLLKFGFEYKKNNYTHNYRRVDLEGLYLDYWVVIRHDPASWYKLAHDIGKIIAADKIWYVHQLQNLYFALTGEELTIKE